MDRLWGKGKNETWLTLQRGLRQGELHGQTAAIPTEVLLCQWQLALSEPKYKQRQSCIQCAGMHTSTVTHTCTFLFGPCTLASLPAAKAGRKTKATQATTRYIRGRQKNISECTCPTLKKMGHSNRTPQWVPLLSTKNWGYNSHGTTKDWKNNII